MHNCCYWLYLLGAVMSPIASPQNNMDVKFKKIQHDKIKRQMLEQSMAFPINSNDLIIESNPQPKNYMESMIQTMAEKLYNEQTQRMLETSPVIQLKDHGDEIRIHPLFPDKLYIQSGKRSKATDDNNIHLWPESNKIGLTLIDGVYT